MSAWTGTCSWGAQTPAASPLLLPPPCCTCGALSGITGALSFLFWRWFRRTVDFSVGALLSFVFVLPVGELPLRLS